MNLKNRRGGFVLLELGLALAVVAVFVSAAIYQAHEAALDREYVRLGEGVKRVAGALNNSLSRDYASWISVPDTPGPVSIAVHVSDSTVVNVPIADWSSPTIPELVALQAGLPTGFIGIAPNGGAYKVQLSKTPAGCVGGACNIDAVVSVNRAVTAGGIVDNARAAIAVREIGVDGARSTRENPTILTGYRAGWSAPNPFSGAGIVAARAGYGSSAWAPFFRLDGTKKMAADGDFGTHSLIDVNEVLSTPKNIGDACTDPGALAGGVVNGKGASFVCRDTTWQLASGRTANAGDVCSPEGATATSLSTDESLVCKDGHYVKLVNLIAHNVEVGRLLVVDGQSVTKPTCDVGGLPDYSFNMNRTSVDISVVPPMQAQYISTVDNGATWAVVLRLRSDSGTELSGNTFSLSATMHLECKY